MTRRRRLAFAVGVCAAVAAVAGARLDSSGAAAAPRVCREWFTDARYRAEIERVRPLVPKMKRAFGAPGLSIAIAANGELVWSESCGFADVRTRRRVARTTQFRIGSVSKPLTAALVARLAQNGTLDVDADVREYVTAFPRNRPRLTLRQLAGHLGGIRHYRGTEALNTRHYDSVTRSLSVFVHDPLVAPPGERFHYSSYGFNLLGAAAETASGAGYAAALRAHVLQPLRMNATALDGAARNRTRFYEVTSTRRAISAPRVDLSDRYPSGGLLSTAEDLVRFGIGVTNAAFVTPPSQSLLFTTQRTQAGAPTSYGFGFEVGDSPVGLVAGHTGNVVGGTAFVLIHPKTRVVVALTTNIGFVTAASPPDLRGAPEPPELAMPFIRSVSNAKE
ncbi:MAG TPA: serine hydrolase domain-containing protein [Gaiellaceae bacterium]|nr:serine hydrolase domain-containing protein [Gaiellaceae bacterium]